MPKSLPVCTYVVVFSPPHSLLDPPHVSPQALLTPGWICLPRVEKRNTPEAKRGQAGGKNARETIIRDRLIASNSESVVCRSGRRNATTQAVARAHLAGETRRGRLAGWLRFAQAGARENNGQPTNLQMSRQRENNMGPKARRGITMPPIIDAPKGRPGILCFGVWTGGPLDRTFGIVKRGLCDAVGGWKT